MLEIRDNTTTREITYRLSRDTPFLGFDSCYDNAQQRSDRIWLAMCRAVDETLSRVGIHTNAFSLNTSPFPFVIFLSNKTVVYHQPEDFDILEAETIYWDIIKKIVVLSYM